MSKDSEYAFLLSTKSSDKWKKFGIKKRAGIVVPVFSIYSKKSVGIGEFDDLRLLVDWCVNNKNSILQLLPLNEVGPFFCPYDSISSFALEPVYIALHQLASADNPAIKKELKQLKDDFPITSRVDYRIKGEKLRILWDMFCIEEKEPTAEFAQFISKNAYWIYDFALFKTLKHHYQGKPWYEWDPAHKNRDEKALKEFSQFHHKAILYHQWVQWHLYNQLTAVKEYAHSRKVYLKGDLPVLVSCDSADVWSHQEFFKLELAAGAPPDMYCARGQRWGMPTYNWDAIRRDKFRYIKEKLIYAQNFYDLLRVDHVVGLFRIWSIPVNDAMEHEGLNGFFDPRDEKEWGKQGREVLSVILDATDMLICAEDLGVIPKVCVDTLNEFGILGNDVQRWVKDWNKRHDFLDPSEYRPASVAMLSTHDTTNWPAWWENEAGTIDEVLFMSKCHDRKIVYERVKPMLFDTLRSRFGRLRWKESVAAVDDLAYILGKPKNEIKDFIELYENTFAEKEKLWAHLELSGKMREKCDSEIMEAAMRLVLEARAIFAINLITDYLYLFDALKGDPVKYRINRPGTISQDNWSLVIPCPLEKLI